MPTLTYTPVRLRWRVPPVATPGGRLFFTAQLAVGRPDHPFSVFVTLPIGRPEAVTDAELELLAPDLLPGVVDALGPGRKVLLFTGLRFVADCEVLPTRD